MLVLYVRAVYRLLKWQSMKGFALYKVILLRNLLCGIGTLRLWLGLRHSQWEKSMQKVKKVFVLIEELLKESLLY